MKREIIFRWIRSKANWIQAVFACFALLVTLNTDLSGIGAEAAGGGFFQILAVQIKKLEYVLPVFAYKDALLALLVFCFFHWSDRVWKSSLSEWCYRIPAALTSFFLLFGYSFRYTNSWDLVFMDTFHALAAAVMLAGYYVLAVRVFRLLTEWVWTLAVSEEEEARGGRLTEWIMEKHAFLGAFLIILLFWSPYILAKFPGSAMPETLAEMRQYYWNDINNYYPPLHTVMLSLLMEFGNLVWSYTFGFFLNLVLQLAMLLSAFAYGFELMRRWKTPYCLRYLALSIICLVQFFPMESTTVEKDIPYAACVIFFVLQLAELVRLVRKEQEPSGLLKAGIVLSCMGTACFRNEGFYLILFSGFAVAVYTWRLLWKEERRACAGILATLFLPVLLFVLYQKVLLPACGVGDNGPKEALSIPFQQTARYVRDYGYELTAEEEEIIGRVLDYENLAELYDPITSDPVKFTYHAETTQELADYFGLWLRQLIRHPGNALEATMNNAYGWFYQEGYAHNYLMTPWIEGQEIRWEINQPAKLAGVRQVMERVAKLLSRVPVLNWFENAGMVSWMTILLIAFLAGTKGRRYLLALTPLIVALLVCIAAPAFQYQVRYIMPVMFCVPYFLPLAVQGIRES